MVTRATPLVVDANIAVKWVTGAEEDSDIALALYAEGVRSGRLFLTPPHFEAETTNGIFRKVARDLLGLEEGRAAVVNLASYRTTMLAPSGILGLGFEIARSLRLSAVYDALYLALAQIVGCELWTADSRLVNAAGGLPVAVRLLSTYDGF